MGIEAENDLEKYLTLAQNVVFDSPDIHRGLFAFNFMETHGGAQKFNRT
jgi:hypothetical protein